MVNQQPIGTISKLQYTLLKNTLIDSYKAVLNDYIELRNTQCNARDPYDPFEVIQA